MKDEVQKPSMGRIVHYVQKFQSGMLADEQGEITQLPAMIISVIQVTDETGTNVDSFDVMLQVFGTQYERSTTFRAGFDPSGKKQGTWHWPERV